MNPSPLFSVIIPTFNRASLLVEAVKSVQQQSFQNWELIVVDDGSTDNTRAIVHPLLKDTRIHYHWQENRELNGARNSGIKLAKGTYLSFLDDDDSYLEDHLTVLANYLKQNQFPVAAVRTGMYFLLSDKRQLKAPLLDIAGRHPVSALWDTPVNLLSFVFHKDIFQQHTFDEDFILAEDFHFLIRVFLNFPFIQLSNYTVLYSLQEERRSNLYFQPEQLNNKVAALRATWKQNKSLLQVHVKEKELEHKITKEYLHFAKAAFRAEDKILGWSYYKEAVRRKDSRYFRSYINTLILGLWK